MCTSIYTVLERTGRRRSLPSGNLPIDAVILEAAQTAAVRNACRLQQNWKVPWAVGLFVFLCACVRVTGNGSSRRSIQMQPWTATQTVDIFSAW